MFNTSFDIFCFYCSITLKKRVFFLLQAVSLDSCDCTPLLVLPHSELYPRCRTETIM